MGEMAVRTRPRKDLAASFHRLRRMVIDVKSARKSFAAHHNLVAELVSLSLYPSLTDSFPRSNLQLDDSHESNLPPLPVFPSKSPANCLDPRRLATLQLNNKQDARVDAKNSLFCSSSASSTTSSFPSPEAITSNISVSLSSTTAVRDISPSCQERESPKGEVLKHAVNPGKRLSQPVFLASLAMVSLCFFLCTGKEIAVFSAVSVYAVIWVIHRLRTILRHAFNKRCSSGPDKDHAQDRHRIYLVRSSTISPKMKSVHFGPTRSQSFPALHGRLHQETGCSKEPDRSAFCESSAVISKDFKPYPARIKLGMMLVLTLCGLLYSQITAVFICLCCILTLKVIQELQFRRRIASNGVS